MSSLLMQIAEEYSRLEGLGLHPVTLLVDAKTKAKLLQEMRDYLQPESYATVMGLRIRDHLFIGDGIFRVMTDDGKWVEVP